MTAALALWGAPICAAWLDSGIALLVAGLLLDWPAARRGWVVAAIGAALAAYLTLSTMTMTEASPADLPAALCQVLWQTHFGAMQRLSLAAWVCLPFGARRRIVAWPAALALIYARAATGHAADAGLLSPALLVHALHIGGMAVWAGTVWLAGLTDPDALQAEALARRVSSLAVWSLGLIVLTGLWNLDRVTHGAPAHAQGDYLAWLGAKGLLIAAAVGLGALNRWRYLPRIARLDGRARRCFWRILRIEGMLLLVVLLLANQLAVTMPD